MLLDGKAHAAHIRSEVAARAQTLTAAGTVPTLALVVATDNPGTAWYVRSLIAAGQRAGVTVRTCDLGSGASHNDVEITLDELSADAGVHGIMLLTPLPSDVRAGEVVQRIDPSKDVDGANPLSAGRLLAGLEAFAPATAKAAIELLDHHNVTIEGRRVVVVGRSNVVGKPLAQLLIERNATVTIAHSRTVDLPAVTRTAEILIAAVGKPGLVTAEHVTAGCVVIDVGTTEDDAGNLLGDVDAASVEPIAAGVSPVPGGVGSLTTAVLLRNVIEAAEYLRS